MAPKIGIFPEIDRAGEHFESATYDCQATYVHAIQEAGGIPIIVPQELHRSHMETVLGQCQGICLVGGPGILMGMSGKLASDLTPVDDRRIGAELEALAYCRKNKKPVLGICYGMQLINVFLGGTVSGDLHAGRPSALIHSPRRNNGDLVEHRLHLNRSFRATARWQFLAGANVNSFHLQAVEKLGQGFECIASSDDGVAEVIESGELPWIGCQFHPERCAESIRKPIFAMFIGRAAADGGKRQAPDLGTAAGAAQAQP